MKAHADMPVPRERLADPAVRQSIREMLYRMLGKLGHVDRASIKFYRDPADGPLSEQGLPNDDTAIVRAVADVTPSH